MNKYLLFILLGSILIISACKKDCEIPNDPSCRNYDPCWESPRVSARFTMWEDLIDTTLEVSQSIFMNRNLLLIADQNHENYRWQIGTEPNERTGKSIVVFFGFPYEAIDITLIVSDTPNTECNPGDDGRDTVSTTIQVLNHDDLPIWGAYTGIDKDRPNDPFTFTIQLDSNQFGKNPAMRNLPNGCDVARNLISGANGFIIETGCYSVSGVAKLSPDKDSIHIEYTHFDPDSISQNPPVNTKISKTFIGKRQ